MLKPAAPTSRPNSTFQPVHKRQHSTGSIPTPKPKQPKRLSQPTPTPLPVLPYTHAEWKKAILEIKREHTGGRYRACASRCSEILDNLKDTSKIEPTYLIFLHFYGAAALEMFTRSLPLNSPYRSNLLRQALSHYTRATSLIQVAEDSVAVKTRPGSASSTRSSCHSPSGSVSSRSSSASTGLSSPTNSICSLDGLDSKSRPAQAAPKRVKKVSFSLPPEPESLPSPEPFIRPDSPTLGFIDDYFQVGASLRELPELPKPKVIQVKSPPRTEDHHLFGDNNNAGDDVFPVVERSVHRYSEHLSSLQTHLASHSEQLKAALERRTPRASEVLLQGRRHSADLSLDPSNDFRVFDRQARIERLKKSGWQRKRFDARRYEELCNAVMAELS